MLINCKNLTITKQGEASDHGSLLIFGLDLNGSTKTAYVDSISHSSYVCVEDKEIASITEVSDNCDGDNELLLSCPGTSGAYTCELVSGKYKISGLSHSGIKEITSFCGDGTCDSGEDCSSCSADCGGCPSDTGEGGGGGGGGGNAGGKKNPPVTTEITCDENWLCTKWSECADEKQTRACTDLNACGTTESKPAESMSCISTPKPVNETGEANKTIQQNAGVTGGVIGDLLDNINFKGILVILIVTGLIVGLYFKIRRKK